MTGHESDSDIETKFTELREREEILQKQLREIRNFQRSISNLMMVSTIKRNEDMTTETKYTLPINYAGNEMDENYRDSQKVALVANINEFLSR